MRDMRHAHANMPARPMSGLNPLPFSFPHVLREHGQFNK